MTFKNLLNKAMLAATLFYGAPKNVYASKDVTGDPKLDRQEQVSDEKGIASFPKDMQNTFRLAHRKCQETTKLIAHVTQVAKDEGLLKTDLRTGNPGKVTLFTWEGKATNDTCNTEVIIQDKNNEFTRFFVGLDGEFLGVNAGVSSHNTSASYDYQSGVLTRSGGIEQNFINGTMKVGGATLHTFYAERENGKGEPCTTLQTADGKFQAFKGYFDYNGPVRETAKAKTAPSRRSEIEM